MLPLLAPGDPGSQFPIMIDGVPLGIYPSEVPMPPEPQFVVREMMDGTRSTSASRPSFAGIANEADPFTLTIDLGALKGNDLVTMERVRARGGHHLLVVWRYTCIMYTLQAGVTRLYLPRKRRCAAHFYSGVVFDPPFNRIVATDILPTLATVDGTPLTVTYATGPTLASPGAGGLVIAKNGETVGAAKNYVPMLLGTSPAGGEELELWTFVTYQCYMRPDIRLRSGLSESHVYVFTES